MFAPVPFLPDHPTYPAPLKEQSPLVDLPNLSAIGNLNILQQSAIALFCSIKCPGDLILKTYDLAQTLRNANIPVISGFHSPMEKECLRLLLRGTQPIIHCPARSLDTMRLSKDQKAAILSERLLLLSPFTASQNRVTAALAEKRNHLVGAIATTVFIAYAAPRGKTEAFAQRLVSQGKPLLTFDSPDTQNLHSFGAKPILPENISAYWQQHLQM